MEFSIKGGSPGKTRTGCVVVGVFDGRRLSAAAQAIDGASRRKISDVLKKGDLEGKLGQTLLLHHVTGVAAERVLLVGLGKERELAETPYRAALSAAMKALRSTGAAEATFCLADVSVKRHDVAWK